MQPPEPTNKSKIPNLLKPFIEKEFPGKRATQLFSEGKLRLLTRHFHQNMKSSKKKPKRVNLKVQSKMIFKDRENTMMFCANAFPGLSIVEC